MAADRRPLPEIGVTKREPVHGRLHATAGHSGGGYGGERSYIVLSFHWYPESTMNRCISPEFVEFDAPIVRFNEKNPSRLQRFGRRRRFGWGRPSSGSRRPFTFGRNLATAAGFGNEG
ncbi:hypothetical protein F511_15481 [Dorcoceras hygrometricum]|uniref:Uncharacterized protein n=1 Tax=Dorcoceras hygrometricum TaxID=472368 RepID=A0A2Z7CP12_9LAMI|nr:hypothetical protein F511_15481 [Dorcoceras hygrometricum]